MFSISFTASTFGQASADLRVSLTSFVAGQPATTLASQLVAANSFQDGSINNHDTFSHTIDFTNANLQLEANTQYALVFSSDTPDANYRIYGNSEGYLQGANYFSQNGSEFSLRSGDLFFQVETGIPAPSSLALISLAALTATRRRR